MRSTVAAIENLVTGKTPPTFTWAGNLLDDQHHPGKAAHLSAFFASSLAAGSAAVGQDNQVSAKLELSVKIIDPNPDIKPEFLPRTGVPILCRERPFDASGLANYPVKPLWKHRSDRADRPVPLGKLIEKEGLISTLPPVIEAVTFVPITAEGAPPDETFPTQFEFYAETGHATMFWVVKQDEELLRRPLIISANGGYRQIRDFAEKDGGGEEEAFFKADFVPTMPTDLANLTPSVRGHFIIIAIPLIGEKPPQLPVDLSYLGHGGDSSVKFCSLFDQPRVPQLQIGEVNISTGDRSGSASKLVDRPQLDTSLLPRIVHLTVFGVRLGDNLDLSNKDVGRALEFPALPN